MRKLILPVFAILLISVSSFSQAPDSLKYQAIVRNAGGFVLSNKAVGLEISILQGSNAGPVVYTETHADTSNTFGLVNLIIGGGTQTLGTFPTIDWSAGPYFVKVGLDPDGGTTYSTIMGTSQLLSVPYALHANAADRVLEFLPPRMTEAQRDAIDSPEEGLLITCTDCNVAGLHQYINGAWEAVINNNQAGDFGTVVNPVTGKVWLDRNLGATQVATSSSDAASYGDMYQWGRAADGHQVRTSATTTGQATSWFSGGGGSHDGLFITTIAGGNWLSTGETHMWSGTSAENNPCPSGFRIPTRAEWNQERLTWTSNNPSGAFASVLKLPATGLRSSGDGGFNFVGTSGYYWSSTATGILATYIVFSSNRGSLDPSSRALGCSVRCIKD